MHRQIARSTKRFISLAVILLWCLRLQQKLFTDPGPHVPADSVPVSLAVPVLNSRSTFMRGVVTIIIHYSLLDIPNLPSY